MVSSGVVLSDLLKAHLTMAASDSSIQTATSPHSYSLRPPSSTFPPASPPLVITPCAACKTLRRRCIADKCVLAPYFPPSDPAKFTTVHRVFGASNIIKFLQELPEGGRADAVSSIVYEAKARIRDPVYGSAGAVWQLQEQVSQLQAKLAMAQAELLSTKTQHDSLVAIVCSLAPSDLPSSSPHDHISNANDHYFQGDHLCHNSFAPNPAAATFVDDSAGQGSAVCGPLYMGMSTN